MQMSQTLLLPKAQAAVAALVVCCVASACRTVNQKTIMNDERVVKRCEKEGIVLEASVPKKAATTSKVIAEIRLINRRDRDIVFYESGYYDDCRIDLKDERGEECPYTDFGQRHLTARSWDYGSESHKSITVKPQEWYRWIIDLSQLFVLKPGKKVLYVSHHFVQGSQKYVPRQQNLWVDSGSGSRPRV
jgi:hypothetical protein